jgi:hypothetical protein
MQGEYAVHDPNDPETLRRRVAVEKWTFGVNVVICLLVLIGMLTWRVLSLPEDDNGGGMVGATVVTGIELVRNLVILEIVRRVFIWNVRRG